MLNGHDEIERARSALFTLDAGCAREEWVRAAMAAKTAGLPEDDFLAWSATGRNYVGEHDARSVWRSIDLNGGVGPGTLFKMARDVGWNDVQPRANGAQGARVSGPMQSEQAKAKTVSNPSFDVAAAFASYPPASAQHPYIAAKRGNPDGLRVVPADDPLTILDKPVAGRLAVPVRSLDGALQTIQYIPAPGSGKKLNAPGASFGNGLLVVGEIVLDGTLYVVEGIGQAWACSKADYQAAAVVAFGCGRVRRVAILLRQCYPAARIVIVSDKGTEADAEAIARDIGGAWVAMPADAPGNYDANDYEGDYGPDALADLLRAAKMPPMRYKLQSANDLQYAPPLRWLVRGLVPANGLAALFGPSGSGKSFLVLDLCAAIAGDVEWFGHRVTAAPVVYVALEGEAGLSQRAKAWSAQNRRALPNDLRFIMQPFNLCDSSDVDDLARAVLAGGGAGLLVLDTLNRAAPGVDENSSRDMSEIIKNLRALQDRIGCTVLVVHHTGKDTSKGLRGHSSLFAALDAAIEVSRDGDRREWSDAKVKEGPEGERYAFALREIDVAEHDDGEPITSCVVTRDDNAAVVKRVKLPKGGNQRIALDAMAQPLRDSRDFNKGDAPFGRPCIEFERAIAIVADCLPCEPKRRKERAIQAITRLVAAGVYGSKGGWLWCK